MILFLLLMINSQPAHAGTPIVEWAPQVDIRLHENDTPTRIEWECVDEDGFIIPTDACLDTQWWVHKHHNNQIIIDRIGGAL